MSSDNSGGFGRLLGLAIVIIVEVAGYFYMNSHLDAYYKPAVEHVQVLGWTETKATGFNYWFVTFNSGCGLTEVGVYLEGKNAKGEAAECVICQGFYGEKSTTLRGARYKPK